MNTRPNVLFLSANMFGLELFKHAKKFADCNFYVMTLTRDSKVVMYDSVDPSAWKNECSKVFEVSSIRSTRALQIIESLDLDVIFLCGWRQILNERILNTPRNGVVSFHPTPLPKGRGSAPIINSILEGWESSAVTMYYADSGIDSGDIIDQESFDISSSDYAIDVYKKCTSSGKKLIEKNIASIVKGDCRSRPQEESDATYLKKITPKDNQINLNDSIEYNVRKVRAFSYPYLGAYIVNQGKKIIIDKARICTEIKKY